MQNYRTVLTIGIIEICIGGITLISNLITSALSQNDKSFAVLAFVITAALVSTLIGAGLLKCRKEAYWLLLYFSSIIIISKLLIFMDVLRLNGELTTVVPVPVNNLISIVYHGFVIVYLRKPDVKQIFHR